MASVALNFVPPDVPDLIELFILESDSEAGTFNVIETVTEIGDYPTYITRYTTDLATSLNGWFKIQWRDFKGAVTPLSMAIQGGSSTTVGEIIDRVLNRNPFADEQTVQQVAEAVIERYFKADPYTIVWADLNYRVREGLTLLVLAFSTMAQSASGGTTKYTAGLVSEEVSSDVGDVSELLRLANMWLGISTTVIAQMEEIVVAGGLNKVEKDQSRLLLSEFA